MEEEFKPKFNMDGCKTSGPVSDRYCQSFFPQKYYFLVLNRGNRASIKKNLDFPLISLMYTLCDLCNDAFFSGK